MKKAGFIGSLVSVLFGAMILVSTSMINELVPKMAYIEFQKLASGTYSTEDYVMNFTFANAVAILFIFGGLVFAAYCFLSENHSKRV